MKPEHAEDLLRSLQRELPHLTRWEALHTSPTPQTFAATHDSAEPVLVSATRDDVTAESVQAAMAELAPQLQAAQAVEPLLQALQVQDYCVTVRSNRGGETLAELIPPGPIFWEDAVWVTQTLGRALSAAHSRGIVHGDLSPASIRLSDTRQPVISGFEVALAQRQSVNKTVSPSADVGGLAFILHAMLCGSSTAGLPGTKTASGIYAQLPDYIARAIERSIGQGAARFGSLALFLNDLEPPPEIRVLPPQGVPTAPPTLALNWGELTATLGDRPERRLHVSGLGVFALPEPALSAPIAQKPGTLAAPNSISFALATYRGWTLATAAVLLIAGIAFVGAVVTPRGDSAASVSSPTVLGITTIAPSSTSTQGPPTTSPPVEEPPRPSSLPPETATPAEPVGTGGSTTTVAPAPPTTARFVTTSPPRSSSSSIAGPATQSSSPVSRAKPSGTTPATTASSTTAGPTTTASTTTASTTTASTTTRPTTTASTTTRPTTRPTTARSTTTIAPPPAEPTDVFAVGRVGVATTFESGTLSFVTTDCASVSFQISGGGALDLSDSGCRTNHSVRLGGVPYNGTQLRPDTSYSVTITARSQAGAVAQRVVQLTTKAQPEAALKISGLTVSEITATTARVSFTANKCVGSSFAVTAGGSGRYDWGYPVSNHCLTDQWATVGYFQSSRLAPGSNTVVVTAQTASGERVTKSISFTLPE